jgi:hypothetical protein
MGYRPRAVFGDVNRTYELRAAATEHVTVTAEQREQAVALLVAAGCPVARATELVQATLEFEREPGVSWHMWLLGQGMVLAPDEVADDVLPELVRRVVDDNDADRYRRPGEALW